MHATNIKKNNKYLYSKVGFVIILLVYYQYMIKHHSIDIFKLKYKVTLRGICQLAIKP